MIETTLPTNLFDKFSDFYENNNNFIHSHDEIRSILVYIGLITVILFILFVIFSLICKCMKMFDDKTITKKTKMQPQPRRYRTNFLATRQTILSSGSSSPLLTNYLTNKSLPKPSLSSNVRTLRYQNKYSLPVMNV